MAFTNSLLLAFNLVATKERIEKERKASNTERVPSALSFLPVNGKVSGPR